MASGSTAQAVFRRQLFMNVDRWEVGCGSGMWGHNGSWKKHGARRHRETQDFFNSYDIMGNFCGKCFDSVIRSEDVTFWKKKLPQQSQIEDNTAWERAHAFMVYGFTDAGQQAVANVGYVATCLRWETHMKEASSSVPFGLTVAGPHPAPWSPTSTSNKQQTANNNNNKSNLELSQLSDSLESW